MTIVQINADSLAKAADILKSGDLVAFPTETVYGLGADATNDGAVQKIYQTKGRPSHNPLIVHVADNAMASRVANLTDMAQKLMAAFWPGPLALVLPHSTAKDAYSLSPTVTAGLKTIAIRCPAAVHARDLITQAGVPIAAPSANASGQTSPTNAIHVTKSLGDKAPALILAGGACDVGLESTIIDVSTETPRLLRHGVITKEQIEHVIGPITVPSIQNDVKPTAPGQLTKHYATKKSLRLNAVDVKDGEALLAFGSVTYMGSTLYGFAKNMPSHLFKNLSPEGDLTEAAVHLFDYMHALDHSDAQAIAVMAIPNEGIGVAINDRLTRAAVK